MGHIRVLHHSLVQKLKAHRKVLGVGGEQVPSLFVTGKVRIVEASHI